MNKDKFADYEAGRILSWEKELYSKLIPVTTTAAGWLIKAYEEVGSTMDHARALIPDIKPGSAGLVIARSQNKGRGRQGRVWQEAESALYGTFVFKSTGKIENFFCLPLVVGLGIAQMFSQLDCESTIKWPNDVLSLSGKKLSGILIEYVKDGDANVFLVGVGINLKGEPSAESRAISLYTETGKIYSPTLIASHLGERLKTDFTKIESAGFSEFREGWLARTRGINAPLSIHLGREIISGIFRGIGPLGYLLLEVDGVLREISSGELILEMDT
jgi:BirA family biotin operon repressor/biotin-[acetyl-CoA-carboxylase] ligase